MERDLTLLEAMRAAIETIRAQSPQEYVNDVRAHSDSPLATSINSIAGDYRGINLQEELCESFHAPAQSYTLKKDKGNTLKYFSVDYAREYCSGAAHMAATLVSPRGHRNDDYANLNAVAA